MAVDTMAGDQFLRSDMSMVDESYLGRARSMTKSLEQKTSNTEFAQLVVRLKHLQEEWIKRQMSRKVPIVHIKGHCNDNDFNIEDTNRRIKRLQQENRKIIATMSSLFTQLNHAQRQNNTMAQETEKLRKVLNETKSYAISLKNRNDTLAADMDFQSSLHEKQRRVWKAKMRSNHSSHPSSDHISHPIPNFSSGDMTALAHNAPNHINSNDVHSVPMTVDLEKVLKEYESTIEKQREQIKYKTEQLVQQKSVMEHEHNQQIAELTKEINQLRNQKQQEVDDLHYKMDQNNAELQRSKVELQRLNKTLELTQNELTANRKLLGASRPLNPSQSERLQQEYYTLNEMMIATQTRVNSMESTLSDKQRELLDANRLIEEQNKRIEELKRSNHLLQSNLAESKSDHSDLINALQQQWDQCKESVMQYKEQCRRLQYEKDELIAKNISISEATKAGHFDDDSADKQILITANSNSSGSSNSSSSSNMSVSQSQSVSISPMNGNNVNGYNHQQNQNRGGNGNGNGMRHNNNGRNQMMQNMHNVPSMSSMTGNQSEYNNDPELVVQLEELQRKLTGKENEIKSQEMLMGQLMEQQKAFQKRNKKLVNKINDLKKKGAQVNMGRLEEGLDTGFNQQYNANINRSHSANNYGQNQYGNAYGQQQQQQMSPPPPETVSIEMKHFYDHYVHNPNIQSNDLINQIRVKSQKVVANNGGRNDYVIPQYDAMRVNSTQVILVVMEDILVQRQRAIHSEHKKVKEILSLKESHQQQLSKRDVDRKKIVFEMKRLQREIEKYSHRMHEMEEQRFYQSSNGDDINSIRSENQRLKVQNERIAQEFLQGANVWKADKAVMSAERVQIENDIAYISHSLEQLIVDRQQFEEEADHFQSLYVSLIGRLREQGMQVEVEYVEEDQYQRLKHSNNHKYPPFAIEDDTRLSQRRSRKRNTMRLKLYQAQTQPPQLKEVNELAYDEDDDIPPVPQQAPIQGQSQNQNHNQNHHNHSSSRRSGHHSSGHHHREHKRSVDRDHNQHYNNNRDHRDSHHNPNRPQRKLSDSLSARSDSREHRNNQRSRPYKTYKRHNENHHSYSNPPPSSRSHGHGHHHSHPTVPPHAHGHGHGMDAPSSPNGQQSPSILQRVASFKQRKKENLNDSNHARPPHGVRRIPSRPQSARSQSQRSYSGSHSQSRSQSQNQRKKRGHSVSDEDQPDPLDVVNIQHHNGGSRNMSSPVANEVVEHDGMVDEADAYIPFDEPDEFNLLDEEYKRLAMNFVTEENAFITQSANLHNGDVNQMAQLVLQRDLDLRGQKLPELKDWIEKKSPTFARGWQKRWVIVKKFNIFYGKTQADIKDPDDADERKQFKNIINLLVVQYIVATDPGKTGRKFEIVARDPRTGDRRHYQWRAPTREICDKWVNGLNAHRKLLKAELQFRAMHYSG